MTFALQWLVATLAVAALALALFSAHTQRRVEAAVPPLGVFVELPDARLHMIDRGQGPALLLVHGLGGQMRNFDHGLIDDLARDHRVIAIDRPGSGYSSWAPGSARSLRAQADLLARLLDRLKLDRPLVVGHSYGGAVALTLAAHHPDRVGGLALIAPLAVPESDPPSAPVQWLIRNRALRTLMAWTAAVPLSLATRERMLARVFAPDAVPEDFGVRGGGGLGLRPAQVLGTLEDLIAVNDGLADLVNDYASIDLPVAVLFGDRDRILNKERQGLAILTRIACATLASHTGGHMLPVTHPMETADWLRGLAGDRACGNELSPRAAAATAPADSGRSAA